VTEKKKDEDKVSFADVLGDASGLGNDEVQKIVDEQEAKRDQQETPAEGPSDNLDLGDNEPGATEMEIADETPQGPRVHIVTGGETLRAIAANYDVSVNDILKRNHDLKHPRHLVKGQEIKIDG